MVSTSKLAKMGTKRAGGGYVKPATSQLELLWDIKETFASQLSICLLSYSLAPQAQYPVQLQQGTSFLNYLVTDEGVDPESVRPIRP